MCKKWQIQSFIYLPGNAQMPGFCIISSSASGGLGGTRTIRLKGRSLHFPPIFKKILLFKILMKPLIMMSFLTYITGFSMNFELLPILTDYAN
jgi:hypothetical protein